MIGRVISAKTDKTATVLVERVAMHPLYKKTFVRTKKYSVDVQVKVNAGDVVEIVKTRPISKNKHWKIAKVVGTNLEEITESALKAEAEKIVAEVMPEDQKTGEPSVVSLQTEEKPNEKQKKLKKRKEKSDS